LVLPLCEAEPTALGVEHVERQDFAGWRAGSALLASAKGGAYTT
jgi:hypothetical protein